MSGDWGLGELSQHPSKTKDDGPSHISVCGALVNSLGAEGVRERK